MAAGLRIAGVLLVAAMTGIAGGYGAGLMSTPGTAMASLDVEAAPVVDDAAPVGDGPEVVVNTPVPDRTRPLVAKELVYRAKEFIANRAVRSKVSVSVPKDWEFTQPEAGEGRYTDPLHKRWIRIEAGFTPVQSTTASMARRIQELQGVDPSQNLTIVSKESGTAVHADGTRLTYSTLTYTYIPQAVRYVVVRWISFGKSDQTAVEMSTTGLPQDREALLSLLQHATETIVRTDIEN